jgi:hypothetical protein
LGLGVNIWAFEICLSSIELRLKDFTHKAGIKEASKLGSEIFCLVGIVKDIKFQFPWTSATDKTFAFK